MTTNKGDCTEESFAFAKSCFFLCLMAIAFWVVAYYVFQLLFQRDTYQAMWVHTRLLYAFQIGVFIGTLMFTRSHSLSIGWVVSMFAIAMIFWIGYTPVAARGELFVREQLDLEKYFEFKQRTIAYSVFSVLQILGYPLAILSGKQKEQKQGARNDEKGDIE